MVRNCSDPKKIDRERVKYLRINYLKGDTDSQKGIKNERQEKGQKEKEELISRRTSATSRIQKLSYQRRIGSSPNNGICVMVFPTHTLCDIIINQTTKSDFL